MGRCIAVAVLALVGYIFIEISVDLIRELTA